MTTIDDQINSITTSTDALNGAHRLCDLNIDDNNNRISLRFYAKYKYLGKVISWIVSLFTHQEFYEYKLNRLALNLINQYNTSSKDAAVKILQNGDENTIQAIRDYQANIGFFLGEAGGKLPEASVRDLPPIVDQMKEAVKEILNSHIDSANTDGTPPTDIRHLPKIIDRIISIFECATMEEYFNDLEASEMEKLTQAITKVKNTTQLINEATNDVFVIINEMLKNIEKFNVDNPFKALEESVDSFLSNPQNATDDDRNTLKEALNLILEDPNIVEVVEIATTKNFNKAKDLLGQVKPPAPQPEPEKAPVTPRQGELQTLTPGLFRDVENMTFGSPLSIRYGKELLKDVERLENNTAALFSVEDLVAQRRGNKAVEAFRASLTETPGKSETPKPPAAVQRTDTPMPPPSTPSQRKVVGWSYTSLFGSASKTRGVTPMGPATIFGKAKRKINFAQGQEV